MTKDDIKIGDIVHINIEGYLPFHAIVSSPPTISKYTKNEFPKSADCYWDIIPFGQILFKSTGTPVKRPFAIWWSFYGRGWTKVTT